jgi:hypothetical protein
MSDVSAVARKAKVEAISGYISLRAIAAVVMRCLLVDRV